MPTRYLYRTAIGLFQIVEHDGMFIPYFGDTPLGNYKRAEFAADDLADGETKPLSCGIDTATLGLPHDLHEWEQYQERAS
jgi:hypothetical protein